MGGECSIFNTVLDFIQNGTPKEAGMGSANNPQEKNTNHGMSIPMELF